jgi:hypothetical protein
MRSTGVFLTKKGGEHKAPFRDLSECDAYSSEIMSVLSDIEERCLWLRSPDSSAGSATFARFLPDSIALQGSAGKRQRMMILMMQRIFKKKQ